MSYHTYEFILTKSAGVLSLYKFSLFFLMRFMIIYPTGAGIVNACCKDLNESHLRNAISSEARDGYRNMYYSTMRFNNFLHSKLLQCCSQSNQYSTRKLLKESSEYSSVSISERSIFLNKVSVLMGYSNVHDLIEQDKFYISSNVDANGLVEYFDFTQIQSKFPCIVLGDSSPIELYNEGTHSLGKMNTLLPKSYNDYFPYSMENSELIQCIGPHSLDIFTPPNFSANARQIDHAVKRLDSKIDTNSSDPIVATHDYIHQTNGDQQNTINSYGIEGMNSVDINLETDKFLEKTVRELPNTISRRSRQLEDSGIHTVRKLLHHFPRTYADFQNVHDEIEDGQYLICPGTVCSSRGIRAGSSFSFLEVIVCCELSNMEPTSKCDDVFSLDKKNIIHLHLKKFFRGTRFTYQPFLKYLQSKYKEGDRVCVSGKVKKMHSADRFEIREFNVDKLQEPEDKFADIDKKPYPIYPSKGGLKPSFLRDIISRTLKILPKNIDPIPIEIVKEFKLLNLDDAYNGIHNPQNLTEADSARIRLIFDEFFYLQLGKLYQMLDALGTKIEKEHLLDKYKTHKLFSIPSEDWTPLTKKLLNSLPYSLTASQLNAVSEIIYDLKRPVPMNRLLQGDVGCGKTVVAFLACMEVIGSGFQAAFMVPTELLAIQHYDHLLNLLETFGQDDYKPSIALLTGSTPTKQSRLILKGLQMGDISMVIGTHTLIADKLEFSALRIAVVDEQHRFGVIQRGRFNSKLYSSSASLRPSVDGTSKDNGFTMAPHVLAMSATPIPRTLALALYGDMSLTQITDMPPGRKPIETFVLEGNESGFEHVFEMMLDELTSGGRIYLVYPIIDESEQLPQLRAAKAEFEVISKKFESYQCGLLHGRMKSEDKDEALKKFRSGETQILLATQVIEIGVDVPDASMMVVMNAERFGIAQLHQLRGRVGRGERKSKCVFLSSTSGTLGRLKVLEKSSDGFYLANADLLLRGPGNLLGKKQSGHIPEFPIARLEVDGNILQQAHLAALKVLASSHDLEKFPSLKAELSMHQPLCILGD